MMRIYESAKDVGARVVNYARGLAGKIHRGLLNRDSLYIKEVEKTKWLERRFEGMYEREETNRQLAASVLEDLRETKQLLEGARAGLVGRVSYLEGKLVDAEQKYETALALALAAEECALSAERGRVDLAHRLQVQVDGAKHSNLRVAEARRAILECRGELAMLRYRNKFAIVVDHCDRVSHISSAAAKMIGFKPSAEEDNGMTGRDIYSFVASSDGKTSAQLRFYLHQVIKTERRDSIPLPRTIIPRGKRKPLRIDLMLDFFYSGGVYVCSVVREESPDEREVRVAKEESARAAKANYEKSVVEAEGNRIDGFLNRQLSKLGIKRHKIGD